MRIHTSLFVLLLMIVSGVVLAQQDSRQQRGAPHAALSVAESGADARGNKLYSVFADNAGTAAILKDLFGKTGDQYIIDEDVAGTVDLRVRGATAEQVLKQVAEAARPPLRIRRDEKGIYKVSRDLTDQSVGVNLNAGGSVPGIVPSVPTGYSQLMAGNRPVTLSIPKERPIPLADALRQISLQTGYPITLDRRVTREVDFSGSITRAPLSLVLQQIADTAKLKLIADANGAALTAPDWFLIKVRDVVMGAMPGAACAGCGERISAEWRYCPNCSRITPLGEREKAGRGAPAPRRGGKMGKIGGE